jgi:hypothetical protein
MLLKEAIVNIAERDNQAGFVEDFAMPRDVRNFAKRGPPEHL